MPQISLYIDESTLRRIEIAAKTERLSLSKYVSQKLQDTLDDQWPNRFGELFGSITDETFRYSASTGTDVPRVSL